MRQQLLDLLNKRVQQCVTSSRDADQPCDKIAKKKAMFRNRKSEIKKVHAKGKINQVKDIEEGIAKVQYQVHFQYLIDQKGFLYIEEEVEWREAEFQKGILVQDLELNPYMYLGISEDKDIGNIEKIEEHEERAAFTYNRLKAVQYAEKWWNSYNPAFKKFEVDCTNYISQCLHAGGAPMMGYPNRSKGWWTRNNNWSYSWSVANSLRWYLSRAKSGLRAKEVTSPEQLLLGDVICYDFEGDGRYNHNTIVTRKDAFGMPLVNAHTHNSRMRYWSYKDSTAYTPNIKYKFFAIVDDD